MNVLYASTGIGWSSSSLVGGEPSTIALRNAWVPPTWSMCACVSTHPLHRLPELGDRGGERLPLRPDHQRVDRPSARRRRRRPRRCSPRLARRLDPGVARRRRAPRGGSESRSKATDRFTFPEHRVSTLGTMQVVKRITSRDRSPAALVVASSPPASPRSRRSRRRPAVDVRGLRRHLVRPRAPDGARLPRSTARGGSADLRDQGRHRRRAQPASSPRATATCRRRAPSAPATSAGSRATRRSRPTRTSPASTRFQRTSSPPPASTATTPLLGIGMSNGARFVTLWGETWKDAGYPVQGDLGEPRPHRRAGRAPGAHGADGLLDVRRTTSPCRRAGSSPTTPRDDERRARRRASSTRPGDAAHRAPLPADPRHRQRTRPSADRRRR